MRERLKNLLMNTRYHANDADLMANYFISKGVFYPPCKPGDIVYDKDGVGFIVKSIELYNPFVYHLHCVGKTFTIGRKTIGRTVFLSLEDIKNSQGD